MGMGVVMMKIIFFHWRSFEPPWDVQGEIYPIFGNMNDVFFPWALPKVIMEIKMSIRNTFRIPKKIIIKFSPGGA